MRSIPATTTEGTLIISSLKFHLIICFLGSFLVPTIWWWNPQNSDLRWRCAGRRMWGNVLGVGPVRQWGKQAGAGSGSGWGWGAALYGNICWDTVAAVGTKPLGCSGARMIFQSWTKLGQELWALVSRHGSGAGGKLSWEEVFLTCQLPAPEGNSVNGTQLGALCSQHAHQLRE